MRLSNSISRTPNIKLILLFQSTTSGSNRARQRVRSFFGLDILSVNSADKIGSFRPAFISLVSTAAFARSRLATSLGAEEDSFFDMPMSSRVGGKSCGSASVLQDSVCFFASHPPLLFCISARYSPGQVLTCRPFRSPRVGHPAKPCAGSARVPRGDCTPSAHIRNQKSNYPCQRGIVWPWSIGI